MSAASPDSTLDGPSGSLPSRFRRSLRVLGLGALGAFALAFTHCGAPPPEAPEAARGDSAPPASSEQVAPSIEPDFEIPSDVDVRPIYTRPTTQDADKDVQLRAALNLLKVDRR